MSRETKATSKWIQDGRFVRSECDFEIIAECGVENGLDHARLIADALNVKDETGMTPRALADRVKTLEQACQKQNESICQALGKALGYPRYCDDQANFPGATEADGACTGDHVAESLATAAAERIRVLEGEKQLAECERDELRITHDGMIREAYRMLGIDGSDGELRAKWMLLELSKLVKKNSTSLANNLCSDHRDKQIGKPCLACEIETLARERDQARKAILDYGNGASFDWDVLGKIDDLELERAEVVAVLKLTLPHIAHPSSCLSDNPSEDWAVKGSMSIENCNCDKRIVRSLIAKLEGTQGE